MVELLHADVTEKILAAAFEVHRVLGPGLIESVYETALAHELQLRGLSVKRPVRFKAPYKDIIAGEFVADLIVQDKVIVELKAANAHSKVFESQIIYYLRGSGVRVGLILNFGMDSLFRKRLVV